MQYAFVPKDIKKRERCALHTHTLSVSSHTMHDGEMIISNKTTGYDMLLAINSITRHTHTHMHTGVSSLSSLRGKSA